MKTSFIQHFKEYIDCRIYLKKVSEGYDIPHFKSFGEPLSVDEEDTIRTIIKKLPDDCIVMTPGDDPIVQLSSDEKDCVSLFMSKTWDERAQKILRPAVLDIFILKNLWKQHQSEKKRYHYVQSKKDYLTQWFDFMTSGNIFTEDMKDLWQLSQVLHAIPSLERLKEDAGKL